MNDPIKGVGLNPNTHLQLTDHLAPLCAILGIPLLLTDQDHASMAEKYYPGLKTLVLNWSDFTPQYLVENFDIFFQSEYWSRKDFYKTFEPLEKVYHKTIRNVHCPHGFSDKVFWFEQSVWEDILLVYGENMMEMLKGLGIEHQLNTTVRTGNYRYHFYRAHQTFYDRLVDELVFSRFDRQQTTLLYAPTCNDQEQNTSFKKGDQILSHLPDSYNLIVKLHPQLLETDPSEVYRMIGKYEKKKNILFLTDFSLVFPILAKSDIYLGDMSSLGYDFLAFNRPMFFLNQCQRDAKHDRHLYLFRCGHEIMPDQYLHFYEIMEQQLPFDQDLYSRIRTDVYHYTFGDEVNFNELKKTIFQAYFSPKKWE